MRLRTVEHAGRTAVVVADGETQVAVLPDQFVDVESLVRAPNDVRRAAVQQALDDSDRLPTAGLAWLPPVLRPGKVLCVALNNSANPERILSGPTTPAMFVKPASSLVGHGRPIRLRANDGRVHPEPELAVVIGRTATDVAEEEATAYVFGYTILNDVTAPGLRGEDTFHLGPSIPTRTPPTACGTSRAG